MIPLARTDAPADAREILHELTNSLAAARMWLVVLGNASPEVRDVLLVETLGKLSRLIGDAEDFSHRLRQLTAPAPPR